MVATAQNDAPQCTCSQKSDWVNPWIQIQSTISMARRRCIYMLYFDSREQNLA